MEARVFDKIARRKGRATEPSESACISVTACPGKLGAPLDALKRPKSEIRIFS